MAAMLHTLGVDPDGVAVQPGLAIAQPVGDGGEFELHRGLGIELIAEIHRVRRTFRKCRHHMGEREQFAA